MRKAGRVVDQGTGRIADDDESLEIKAHRSTAPNEDLLTPGRGRAVSNTAPRGNADFPVQDPRQIVLQGVELGAPGAGIVVNELDKEPDLFRGELGRVPGSARGPKAARPPRVGRPRRSVPGGGVRRGRCQVVQHSWRSSHGPRSGRPWGSGSDQGRHIIIRIGELPGKPMPAPKEKRENRGQWPAGALRRNLVSGLR